MNKAQIIAHAKDYLEMLAQGIDPISKNPAADDSVVSQPRMQKCFAMVADVLGELLANNGFVALDEGSASRYQLVHTKEAFSLSREQMRNIHVYQSPVSASILLKSINSVVDTNRMEKLSSKHINAWLLKNGYITETKEPATINRTVRYPTEKSTAIGIFNSEYIDPKTGEVKHRIIFSEQAQNILLANLPEIAGEDVK